MWTNKKALRLLTMLVVAVMLMTTVALATDLNAVANNILSFFTGLASVAIICGTVWAIIKLITSRNWILMIITMIGGFGMAYLVTQPELVKTVIGNTVRQVMGG